MNESYSILRSTKVITPTGIKEHDICFKEGKITELLPWGKANNGLIKDVGELVVMPGIVDSHVHVNEPGRTEWEGFQTATHAAAAGGITTFADMPLNSDPVTTTVKAFEKKLNSSRSKLAVDCAYWGGLIPDNISDLAPLMDSGISGFKAFLIHSGIDDFPNATENDLRAGMPIIAKRGLPLLVHAELDLAGEAKPIAIENRSQYQAFLASRPKKWELDAIALMIRLCRETECPVHIVHLSCAEALPMIEKAKAEGLPLTVETCSHYLTLCAEQIKEGDTRFKCAPPIREQANAELLWKGLADGVIDFIVSDHSPCTPELKLMDQGDFEGAWGGISSLQFGLPVIWTEAKRRGFDLKQLTQWMCQNPAKLLKLQHQKGQILPGFDADFVVWNPAGEITIEPSLIQHKHKITPYEGKKLSGKIENTFLRGNLIYSQENFLSSCGSSIFQTR